MILYDFIYINNLQFSGKCLSNTLKNILSIFVFPQKKYKDIEAYGKFMLEYRCFLFVFLGFLLLKLSSVQPNQYQDGGRLVSTGLSK